MHLLRLTPTPRPNGWHISTSLHRECEAYHARLLRHRKTGLRVEYLGRSGRWSDRPIPPAGQEWCCWDSRAEHPVVSAGLDCPAYTKTKYGIFGYGRNPRQARADYERRLKQLRWG